jgi:pimeloyl-ACP methyl ester carboxylesterase
VTGTPAAPSALSAGLAGGPAVGTLAALSVGSQVASAVGTLAALSVGSQVASAVGTPAALAALSAGSQVASVGPAADTGERPSRHHQVRRQAGRGRRSMLPGNLGQMTDQIVPSTAPGLSGHAAPIAKWPGELVSLPAVGDVFVRAAPAQPGAEPALFVHGLGGSASNWTDLMGLVCQPSEQPGVPALACEALDLPGFGYSPPPADGDYSLDARVAAVIALIEQRANWPVHLIGNSMGGAIVTRIAARRSDLVRSLTLVSPAMPDLRPRLLPMRLALVSTPGVGRMVMTRMARYPAEKRTDMTIMDLYADPALLHPVRRAEAIAEVTRRDGLSHSADALLESGRALVSEYMRRGPGSLWRDAARVSAPTLVIHGSHDRLVNPQTAARAARTFRTCRVVVLPKIGHVAMMERPDLVAAEMRSFLASAAKGPGGPAAGRSLADQAIG